MESWWNIASQVGFYALIYLCVGIPGTVYVFYVMERSTELSRGEQMVEDAATTIFSLIIWPYLYLWAWPMSYRRRRASEREKMAYERAKAARDQRIAEWKTANTPIVYYNKMNGVVVVLTQFEFESALKRFNRNKRDGIATRDLFAIDPNSRLYIHASAADRVPKEFVTGRLSNFDDIAKVTKIVRDRRIFVPFTMEAGTPQHNYQKSVVCPATEVSKAHSKLTHVEIPESVISGK